MFRHQRQDVLAAFAQVSPESTKASKAQFEAALGQLMLWPGDADFNAIWRKHDPRGTGLVDYEAFGLPACQACD